MNVIQTNNLNKFYKTTCALQNVNMTLKKGDIYGLIGKNGAGKTTLMRIICGLTYASTGTFTLLGGSDINAVTANRKYISAIIESPSLYKNFNARKNLQTVALLKGIDKNSKVIDELLEFSGLQNTGNKKVKFFSLGMRQRLAIAIALLGNPEVLILDEPINGLDPVGIVEIRDMLIKLNKEKGVTILISSHILSELEHLATRYGIINNGCLIEEITATELMSKMTKTTNIVFADKNDLEKAANILKEQFNITDFKIEGDTIAILCDIENEISKINLALAKENILLKGISTIGTNLEQYFIERTRGQK